MIRLRHTFLAFALLASMLLACSCDNSQDAAQPQAPPAAGDQAATSPAKSQTNDSQAIESQAAEPQATEAAPPETAQTAPEKKTPAETAPSAADPAKEASAAADSSEASSGDTTSGEAAPAETTSGETAPAETPLANAASSEAGPAKETPSAETLSSNALSAEAPSKEAETISNEAAAQKTAQDSAQAPAPSSAETPAEDPASARLKILQFLPRGPVPKLSQIVVMFNQPMVALGDFNQVNQDQMTLEPPLEGSLRWLNQYTLAFIPEKAYEGSLTVTATLKGGLKSLSGEVLEKGESVSIFLPDIKAIAESYQETFNEEHPYRPIHRVYFTQPVDYDHLNSLAFFEGNEEFEGDFSVPAIFSQNPNQLSYESERFRSFAVPANDLPKNSKYRLVIKPGAISTLGPRPLEETVTVLEAITYGPLLTELTQGELDESGLMKPESGLSLNFSVPILTGPALEMITSDPPIPELENLKAGYRALLAAKEADKKAKEAKEAPEAEGTEKAEVETAQTAPPDVPRWVDYYHFEKPTTSLFIWPHLKANTLYTLTLKKELKDVLGQTMAEDSVIRFKTGAYPPYAEISGSRGGIFEVGTEPRIPIEAASRNSVSIEGWALSPIDAVKFINLADGDMDRVYLGRDNPKARDFYGFLNQAAVYRRLFVNTGPKSFELPITESFSLADLFKGELSGNVLFVQATDAEYQKLAIFQVTSLGLTVKTGRESSLAWVTDLATGENVTGAKIEILSRAGTPLGTAETGPDGLAKLPGGLAINEMVKTRNLDLAKELGEDYNALFYVVASHNGQSVLWSTNQNDAYPLYNYNLGGGYARPLGANPSKSFLLSSQPIYRPGSLVRLKIIHREAMGEELSDLPQGPVKVLIQDPFSKTVYETQGEASQFGTVNVDFQLPSDSALGWHFVFLSKDANASFPSGENLWYQSGVIEIGSFNVQAFRSPPFDIEFEDAPKEVISGDTFSVKAKASYHFGSPVAGRPGKYAVLEDDAADFSIPGLSGFSFTNSCDYIPIDKDVDDSYVPAAELISSGDFTLDDSGGTSFSVSLEAEPKPRPRSLGLILTATDVDGRSVSKQAAVLAHPADLYPALKLRNYLAKAGNPQTFDLAAASPDGALKEAEISLTLYKRSLTTVRRRNYSVSYIYDSRAYDEIVEERTLQIDSSLAEVEFTPPDPGSYWLKAALKDSKGRPNEASVFFYATGPGPVGWRYENSDTVTMVPDKPRYVPGDVARILVQSPFSSGQALVTVERAFIRDERIIELTDQSPVIEVPITDSDAPNIFVSVILNRGRIAEKPDNQGVDLGKPANRLGYATLLVDGDPNKLQVEVKPEKDAYSPGDEVNLDIAVSSVSGDPFSEAEVALAVIDTSLVQVAGEDNYFPDSVFSSLRALTVSTASPINSIISRRNWDKKGGIGQEAGGGDFTARNRESDARSNFLDLAHFEPAIILSEDGRAKTSFKLPDNLTTFKIYAVATGHGRFSGTGQGQVVSSKDLLLRSSLPAFASVGDEFSAGVIITNRLASSGKAKVSVSAEGLALTGPSGVKDIDVPAGQSAEVLFPARADIAGSARLSFKVTMGDLSDEMVLSLPIKAANLASVQASYRQIEAGEIEVPLSLIPDFEPSLGGLSVALAPSLVGVLSEPFKWLESYPYDCLEQTTSKAFGSLLRLRLADRLSSDVEDVSISQEKVERHIRLLASSQGARGGFSLWPSASYSSSGDSPYLTAFVLEFLLSANDNGFEVPEIMMTRAIDYLESYLSDPLSSESGAGDVRGATALYALQALARASRPVEPYVETHFRNAPDYDDISLLYLTRAVYHLPKSASRTERLLDLLPLIQNRLELTSGQAKISAGFRRLWFGPDKLTALAALTLSEAAPHNVFLEGLIRNLVTGSKSGRFSSTQSNILALWAIANYLEAIESVHPAIKVETEIDGKTILDTSFRSFTQSPEEAFLPLYDLKEGDSVRLSAQGSGKIWSTIKLSQARKTAVLEPETAAGLIISRSYTVIRPEIEPEETSFSRGQVVKVDLVLMTPEDRTDIVVEDSIPAGFEPINFNLQSEDQSLISTLNPDSQEESPRRASWNWYSHQQTWPDKVAIFADYLPAGVYNFSYLVRPATPGVYRVTGPKAEGMYEPEAFGRGQGHVIKISE